MTLSWFLLDVILIAHLAHMIAQKMPHLAHWDDWWTWLGIVFCEVWVARLLVYKTTLLLMGVPDAN